MNLRGGGRSSALARLLLAGLLFALLLRAVDLGGALGVLAKIEPFWIIPVLGLFGLGQVLSCLRWRLSLAQIVASPPSVPVLLRLYLIGMFVNLGIPTMAGGDIARAEFMRGLIGARGSAYASVLADRLIGALAVVIVATGAILSGAAMIEAGTRHIALIAGLVLTMALVAIVIGLRWIASGRRWPRLAVFLDALQALARKPKILALSLAIAIVVQIAGVVLPITLIAQAMALQIPMAVHFVLVPIIVLITLVPLAPGGLGVRETAFVVLYGQFGVGAEAAFALGLAWSLVLIAYGLVGGVLLFVGQRHPDPSG